MTQTLEPPTMAETSTKPTPVEVTADHTALVVLSGGQDSTTCLFWAKQRFQRVTAVTFNYGQRHAREIEAARKVAELAGVEQEVIDVGPVLIGSSPLVNRRNAVEHYDNIASMPGGIEPTFVPGRNALFLVIAYNRAMAAKANFVVTGVSQADYGGYPDCRDTFIRSMQEAMNQAMFGSAFGITIEAPLLDMTKAQTVLLAAKLPGCMDALAYSHTCYDGEYPPNPNNHASMIRARGFDVAGYPDPLIARAIREGLLPLDYPDSGYVVGTKYATPDALAEWRKKVQDEKEAAKDQAAPKNGTE